MCPMVNMSSVIKYVYLLHCKSIKYSLIQVKSIYQSRGKIKQMEHCTVTFTAGCFVHLLTTNDVATINTFYVNLVYIDVALRLFVINIPKSINMTNDVFDIHFHVQLIYQLAN